LAAGRLSTGYAGRVSLLAGCSQTPPVPAACS